MTTVTEVGHASGFSIDVTHDATMTPTYRWRVWYGPASEGNVTATRIEAEAAVEEAFERVRVRATG